MYWINLVVLLIYPTQSPAEQCHYKVKFKKLVKILNKLYFAQKINYRPKRVYYFILECKLFMIIMHLNSHLWAQSRLAQLIMLTSTTDKSIFITHKSGATVYTKLASQLWRMMSWELTSKTDIGRHTLTFNEQLTSFHATAKICSSTLYRILTDFIDVAILLESVICGYKAMMLLLPHHFLEG